VSGDQAIDAWLASKGYASAEAKAAARGELEAQGLTRAGKQRMSDEKLPRAEEMLRAKFALHCTTPECTAWARASGRLALQCEPRTACERCGGSENRRAETELKEAFRRAGVKKFLVVGGSPSVREDLEEHLGDDISLRLIDGTERRTLDRARADLEWADVALVWGASELHHKVSLQYTQAPPPLNKKVVNSRQRGIKMALGEVVEHLGRRGKAR
jgi:hypothetical protein